MASRLTVLYGETGVGKSSVLRAGVAHHLRDVARRNLESSGEPGLAVVVFDDWRDDPVQALRSAVAAAVADALGATLRPPEEDDSLAGAMRLWQQVLAGDLYVILDQIEEYFLYHEADDVAGRFAAEFPAAVRRRGLAGELPARDPRGRGREARRVQGPESRTCSETTFGSSISTRTLLGRRSSGPIAQYNRMVGEDETVEIEPDLVDAVLEQVAAGKVDVGQAGRGTVAGQRRSGPDRDAVPPARDAAALGRASGRPGRGHSGSTRCAGSAERSASCATTSTVRSRTSRPPSRTSRPASSTTSSRRPGHEDRPRARRSRDVRGNAPKPSSCRSSTSSVSERILRSVSGNGHGSHYEIFHDVLAEPVLAWKAAHDARRELERQRAEAERRHRRLVGVLAFAAAVLAVMVGVTVFALTQRSEARSQRSGRESAGARRPGRRHSCRPILSSDLRSRCDPPASSPRPRARTCSDKR